MAGRAMGIVAMVVACTLIASLVIAFSWRPATQGVNPITFEMGGIKFVIECGIPGDLPTAVPLLRVMPFPIPVEEWLYVAEHVFNMTGELEVKEVKLDEVQICIRSSQATLMIMYGGSFLWDKETAPHAIPSWMTPEKAKSIADRVLARLEERQLAPPGLEVEFSRAYYSEWCNIGYGDYPIAITASYRVSFQGLPFVEGLYITVRGSSVAEVWAYWKFFQVVGSVEVMPVEEALKRLPSYLPVFRCPCRITTVVVKEIELGYMNAAHFPNGEPANKTYLLPVYMFRSVLILEYYIDHRYDAVNATIFVPAVE
ncbi:hypothetical protein B6U66_00380 [Candidatus Bathyarchaeota archaeon ex4484_135]|nr:MAG: hypothetical protein B6U66_00380 [Candidatus Bathyarchaeota archaeon ex4484_135]